MDCSLHLAQCAISAVEQSSIGAADFWLIVFSAIVAVSTVVYAFLTWRLVGETKKVRLAQTEPMVSVTHLSNEKGGPFIDLRIKNVGAGPALDITFEVEPEFEYLQGKPLSELHLFRNGLKYLGPGDERRFFLTSLIENRGARAVSRFEVRVTYRGTIGRHKTEGFVIDLSEWDGIGQLGKPYLSEIADSMKSLAKKLGN